MPVGDEDHEVAGVHQVRRGAVDADHAAAALAGDDVGLQPRAVGDVDDRDLLARQQVGGLHQVLVDGHRADVVQVGLRHRGPVDLGLQHRAEHVSSPLLVAARRATPATLSIRRVEPTRAATSSRASPFSGAGPRSGPRSSR